MPGVVRHVAPFVGLWRPIRGGDKVDHPVVSAQEALFRGADGLEHRTPCMRGHVGLGVHRATVGDEDRRQIRRCADGGQSVLELDLQQDIRFRAWRPLLSVFSWRPRGGARARAGGKQAGGRASGGRGAPGGAILLVLLLLLNLQPDERSLKRKRRSDGLVAAARPHKRRYLRGDHHVVPGGLCTCLQRRQCGGFACTRPTRQRNRD